MTPETVSPPWVQLVPLVFFSMFYVAAAWWLAPRKGISPYYALLGLIPCVGTVGILIFVVYLLSRTDKAVLDEISALKRRLNAVEGKLSNSPPIP